MSVTRHPLCTTGTTDRLPPILPDDALIGRLEHSFREATRRESAFAECFYSLLFAQNPGLRSLFAADMTAQNRKLVDGLRLVVDNLRKPQTVRAVLEELGRAHVRFGARPEHYPIVRDALVAAMAEQVGSEWTPELRHDWLGAIRLVSEIMLEGSRPSMT